MARYSRRPSPITGGRARPSAAFCLSSLRLRLRFWRLARSSGLISCVGASIKSPANQAFEATDYRASLPVFGPYPYLLNGQYRRMYQRCSLSSPRRRGPRHHRDRVVHFMSVLLSIDWPNQAIEATGYRALSTVLGVHCSSSCARSSHHWHCSQTHSRVSFSPSGPQPPTSWPIAPEPSHAGHLATLSSPMATANKGWSLLPPCRRSSRSFRFSLGWQRLTPDV